MSSTKSPLLNILKTMSSKKLRDSAGKNFRAALKNERPLQIAGAINAYTAILAEKSGFRALYLSGAGVANASYGVPDLGITTLENVLEDARRITNVTNLPLLVDIDTGWGSNRSIALTIKEMTKAGVAAVHIEDQVDLKRCGHRPNKQLVSTKKMVDRIKAAVDARTDSSFVIMARTDAAAGEGLSSAIERACYYRDAGADMIFAEALTKLDQYRQFSKQVGIPILANMTEFGKTPLYTTAELKSAGVSMVLYPLSAFRAMNAAALNVYQVIRTKGTQRTALKQMQTREELYKFLNYHQQEQKLDKRLAKGKKK
jgi:methylisocitrate lyase